MNRPRCAAPDPYQPGRRTGLGYRTFRRRACARTWNGRPGTPCTHLEYPADAVALVMLWRLRYPLRLRHLAELSMGSSPLATRRSARDAMVAPLLAEWSGALPLCTERDAPLALMADWSARSGE